MVDTAVRPRPEFRTFLQSDTNAKGDALSVYEYKRQLRAKKVAFLQEKQAQRRVPGYKLPTNYYHQQQPNAVTGIVKREPATVKKTDAVAQTAETTPAETEEQQQPGIQTRCVYLFSLDWVFKGKSVAAGVARDLAATNKVSDAIKRETRQIKSAKEHTDTVCDTEDTQPKTRPKTARDAHAQPRLGQPMANKDEANKEDTCQVSTSHEGNSMSHQASP